MDFHRGHSRRDDGASPPLPARSQPLPSGASSSPASQLLPRPRAPTPMSPAAPTPTPRAPASPTPTPRAPAAPTPTPRAPAAPTPTPRSPGDPTPTPRVTAADLEEHKGTVELLRAIKIEKATGPDLEEHKGAADLHMEPGKCRKRKRSRQISGELHGEHKETNKVDMKASTSKKKRKASKEMCTNPPEPLLAPSVIDMDKQAPPLKHKRLNKRDVATTPSIGSLLVDKNKQPSSESLLVDKNKQPSSESLLVDKNKQPSSESLPVDKNGKKCDSEWEMAEAICHLLGTFYTATKQIPGRTYPTSHLYFYEVWNVKQIMEKEVVSENPTIVTMVKEMEKKWMKYFEESFLTSYLPVIFDPRYKYEYVHFRLTTAFGDGAKKHLTKVNSAMNILFAEYASEFENTSDEGDEVAEEDGEGTLDDRDKHLRLKRSHNSNELQRYLDEDLFPRRQKLDILKWWQIHSPKYPVLAAIARDILAVSASTVPAEVAFSNAGRIITDQRSSLTPSTVETLMCLQDWFRAADRQKVEPTVGNHGGDLEDAGTT